MICCISNYCRLGTRISLVRSLDIARLVEHRKWITSPHDPLVEAKDTVQVLSDVDHESPHDLDGIWQSIDHVLVSSALRTAVDSTYINDAPFLLEEDKKYGGVKPFRTYNGYRYQRGFSDHLPLVVCLDIARTFFFQ